MTDVVLHIGLHKTATRFLQRALFRNLDTDLFLCNPPGLERKLRRALRSHSRQDLEAVRTAAREAIDQAGDRTLLVSDPGIAGDMYSSYEDWRRNLDIVHELFPGARIIYFVRRPWDWLLSAYRQVLSKGRGVPIEFFLNFREGAFRPRDARYVGGARNLNALELPFRAIYLGYADRFGAERVYLFRQEDLRARPEDVYARLADALGLDRLPPLPERVSGNRAMSALAVHLFFPGVYFRPRSRDHEPPRDGWWLRARRRLRRWRTVFIQHVFDRLVYRDWDLLARGGMREVLERHYADEYNALSRAAQAILDHGPGETARSAAAENGTERSGA